jgi:hypothetical protein
MTGYTMDHILGETNEELKAITLQENIDAAIAMVRQSRYSIDIFTQDMDRDIYDNEQIEQYVFELSKRHPSTRVRILVQDSSRAAQRGHCLVRLAQTLTSSVFINKPSREYRDELSAFMVVDQIGVMHRVSAKRKNFNTSINFRSPQHAAKLTEFFAEVWEHSSPDEQIRRLYV